MYKKPNSFGQLPNDNDLRDLPPDLWPRFPREGPYKRDLDAPADRGVAPPQIGNAIYLSRSLIGQTIVVGTTPVLLVRSTVLWPWIVLNPSQSVGLTSSVTGFSGTASTGDLTAPGIGVAGFESAHLHLNVTAMTGGALWDIYAQTFDSISGVWMDSQAVFTNIAATGSYYAFPNTFGIATDLRFRYVRTAGAGTLTNSIGVALKVGSGGSSTGLAQVIYVGGEGVTTVSGFPILEGTSLTFVIEEGVELWAVAATTLNARLFML